MDERFERDEYSSEEYSDTTINIGCVCSWSINDVPNRRPLVTITTPDGVVLNSDRARWLSDERLHLLAARLRQAAANIQIRRGSTVRSRRSCPPS